MEDILLHNLLRHCIKNRRDVRPRFDVGRLKRLEIYDCRSYDLDDKRKFITHFKW